MNACGASYEFIMNALASDRTGMYLDLGIFYYRKNNRSRIFMVPPAAFEAIWVTS